MSTFSIDPVFHGPPASANGGYACGTLAGLAEAAGHLTGPAAVTLHLPVPLDTPLEYRVAGRRGHAWHGEDVVASVASAHGEIPDPAPVTVEQAGRAQAAFDGSGHPFPTCFACGTQRPGTGLGLRPGPVEGRPYTVACTWTPAPWSAGSDGLVPPEIVWSALDCPGGWTTDPVRRPRLLGRMTAEIRALPPAGQTCVVVAELERTEERTALNTTALYDGRTGTLLAKASALWIAVDLATVR
ncbi:hypothetical protein [Streptomyces fragilis]|uniref:Thioesterase family protein n=1 Tax=Streptomyces fragilis TaxID=67301 RepID=A0ABV2YGI8_9ACTN|nr:hypothetical protein [Streptomyces fragilis]